MAGLVTGEGILELGAVPFRTDVNALLNSAHGGRKDNIVLDLSGTKIFFGDDASTCATVGLRTEVGIKVCRSTYPKVIPVGE
jgi:hypothetical protein